MEELISVIMSTYNEDPDWIKKSINSILNQTYSNFEFLIVLDNPKNKVIKDLVFEYQDKDNRIKVIQNKENMGLVNSLNIALEHCNGKYIARMDADDISIRDRFSIEKKYLEDNKLDFVFSGMMTIDENGNELHEWDNKELNVEEVKKVMEVWNISTHPTWFVKSDVYKNLGGYRDIPYCEDYDFSLRSLKLGYKIGKINENLLMYRMRNNSISRSNSFEQFIVSRKIIGLYKRNKLEDFSYVNKITNKLKERINTVEKERYIKAEAIFQQGIKLIKNHQYHIGISKMLKSIFLSKYYILRIFDTIKYKSLIK
jgi:glycosyltransferase involved in cell wall biosynthesis